MSLDAAPLPHSLPDSTSERGASSPVSRRGESVRGEVGGGSPQDVLAWALERWRGRIALVSSFGTESAVLLHLAAQVDPSVPVIFLDTGHLFAQTLDYRADLARKLGLTDVRDIRAAYADLALNDPKADLWRTSTDACCAVRKVQPLDRALKGFDAWITGRKRFQGAERARLPTVEAAEDGRVKVNPLANWTRAELDSYVAAHDLPAHPMIAQGYASVGCWPCTRPSDDGRAGRWAGSEKTECGIHRPRKPAPDLGGGL